MTTPNAPTAKDPRLMDPRLREPLSERDRQEAMRHAFRNTFKDDDDFAWWAHDNARALARYESTVTSLTAALLAARREVEARDARVDELEEAARSAVDARELFDSLGIPPEMQDACFSDDTQDWIAWTFRSYLAALAATQEGASAGLAQSTEEKR